MWSSTFKPGPSYYMTRILASSMEKPYFNKAASYTRDSRRAFLDNRFALNPCERNHQAIFVWVSQLYRYACSCISISILSLSNQVCHYTIELLFCKAVHLSFIEGLWTDVNLIPQPCWNQISIFLGESVNRCRVSLPIYTCLNLISTIILSELRK